jgi:hypothetical protein
MNSHSFFFQPSMLVEEVARRKLIQGRHDYHSSVTPGVGPFGNWSTWAMCPAGQYAIGYKMRPHASQVKAFMLLEAQVGAAMVRLLIAPQGQRFAVRASRSKRGRATAMIQR